MSFYTGKHKIYDTARHLRTYRSIVEKRDLWHKSLNTGNAFIFLWKSWLYFLTHKLLIWYSDIFALSLKKKILLTRGNDLVTAHSTQCSFQAQIRHTTQNMTDMFCLPITLICGGLHTGECNWSRKLNSITMQLEKSQEMTKDCRLRFWQLLCLRLPLLLAFLI